MDRSQSESTSKKNYLNQKLLEKRKRNSPASRISIHGQAASDNMVIKPISEQRFGVKDATVSIINVEPVTFASDDVANSRGLGRSFDPSVVPITDVRQLLALNAHTWILIVFTIIFAVTNCLTKRFGSSKSEPTYNPQSTVNEFVDAYDAVSAICQLGKQLESDTNAYYLLGRVLAEVQCRVDHREWIKSSEELNHLCFMTKDCASKISNRRRIMYSQARSLPKHLLHQRDSSFEIQENMAEVELGMWSLLRAVAERQLNEHSQQHLLQLESFDISPPLLTTEMETANMSRQISIGQQQQEIRANLSQSVQRRESDCKNDLLRLQGFRFDLKRQLLERSTHLHWLNRAVFTISFALFVLSAVAKLSECTQSRNISDFGTCVVSNAAQRTCIYLRSCDNNGSDYMKNETVGNGSSSMIWDPMLSFTLPMLNYLQVYVSSYLGDSMGHTICAILIGIRVLPCLLITWFFNMIWFPAIGSYLSWITLIVAFADVMQRVIVGPMWPVLIITAAHLILYWIGHVIIDWKDWSMSHLTIAYSVYTAVLVLLPWTWELVSHLL